jgi:hypothetical protein
LSIIKDIEFSIPAEPTPMFLVPMDLTESYFWEGYMLGLRRFFHGESSIPNDEHLFRMNEANTKIDSRIRMRGFGYQAGEAGKKVGEASAIFDSLRRENGLS